MKKFAIYFGIAQAIILILMLSVYGEIGLLPYINMSFTVGGLIMFTGLVIYVVSSGFFDLFTTSFKRVFTPKHKLKDVQEMRPPSELLSFPYVPFLLVGSTIILIMSVFLYIYYQ